MYFKFFRKKKEVITGKGKVIVCTTMRDYSKEEFFINKVNAAKEMLDKFGLPKDLAGK
jgi:hypothetical protein